MSGLQSTSKCGVFASMERTSSARCLSLCRCHVAMRVWLNGCAIIKRKRTRGKRQQPHRERKLIGQSQGAGACAVSAQSLLCGANCAGYSNTGHVLGGGGMTYDSSPTSSCTVSSVMTPINPRPLQRPCPTSEWRLLTCTAPVPSTQVMSLTISHCAGMQEAGDDAARQHKAWCSSSIAHQPSPQGSMPHAGWRPACSTYHKRSVL